MLKFLLGTADLTDIHDWYPGSYLNEVAGKFLNWMFAGLWDLIKGAFAWTRDTIWVPIADMFAALAEGWEAVLEWKTTFLTNLGEFTTYLAFANAWVPVDLFFTLVAAYMAFMLVVLTYRILKSFIPGAGSSGT